MAKAAITKKISLSANGILAIEDGEVALENADTGEMIPFEILLEDFKDKSVKISVAYDEDFE